MNLNRQHTKIFSLAVQGYENIFLHTHLVNPVQDYYICKPIAGLLSTSVNFFQDESYL
jgi:hypothetical protein